MARATKKSARRSSAPTAMTIADVRGSAREIWLAGIGAMAVAEEESSKLFSTLVKKGTAYETRNRQRVDQALTGLVDLRQDAMQNISSAGTSLRRTAGRTLERVESTIDAGVASALDRLGVPTRNEIHALTQKVERLTATLERSGSARGAKTARTRSARKAAAE
jgi:poly(hydroxyalkanoate) granule-associated protein